jgi:hypothetical protein
MHSGEHAIALVERTLRVRLPRQLFSTEGRRLLGEPVDPGALLEPDGGVVQGGWMLPDSLPFERGAGGDALLLRFDAAGEPLEIVEWRADCKWHPREVADGFPSASARRLEEARRALRSGLAQLAERIGRTALAHDLGVTAETFSDWLLDARLVPEGHRAVLRRLTGEDDDSLFTQDWAAAATAARAASERRQLAWPGAVLGWVEEGRGDAAAAAEWYGVALRADAPTLELGARLGRPGESALRAVEEAWRRCAGDGRTVDPELGAAVEGARAVRAYHLAESDRLRAAGRHAAALEAARRAGWRRHFPADMDDVLGRMGDTAEEAASPALAALARLHLRCWAAGR